MLCIPMWVVWTFVGVTVLLIVLGPILAMYFALKLGIGCR